MKNLKSIRLQNLSMAQEVLVAIEMDVSKASEFERQVIAAFFFGMTFPITQIERLNAPEAHALILHLLQDALNYDPEGAAEIAAIMIEAAKDAEFHDTIHAIIHRGIDGHEQWSDGRIPELVASIQHIFRVIQLEQ